VKAIGGGHPGASMKQEYNPQIFGDIYFSETTKTLFVLLNIIRNKKNRKIYLKFVTADKTFPP
jgi:hypothetical protein